MLQLLSETYKSYFNSALGRPERHTFRLVGFASISLAFALFSPKSLSDVYSMMATGVTVLTGFTFTALFSDQALASSGLPAPKNENDRHDLLILKSLSQNFRIRSSYFIAISIFEVVILIAASFDFSVPSEFGLSILRGSWMQSLNSQSWFLVIEKTLPYFSTSFALLINFIYLECLYTFYRMAETIIAIIDIRQTYLDTIHQADH